MVTSFHLTAAAESTARSLAESGQPAAAFDIIRRLLNRPECNGATATRLHRLAATLLSSMSRPGAARKHLGTAHRSDPHDAETVYQLGLHHETDADGDREKAVKCFRLATSLAPRNARYLAAYGLSAIRAGQIDAGMQAMEQAVEIRPGEIAILRLAIEACRLAGKSAHAQRWISRARFLAPNDAAIRSLWDRVKFDLAFESQQAAQPKPQPAETVPFLRIVGDDRIPVRRDAGRQAKPHFPRLAAKMN